MKGELNTYSQTKQTIKTAGKIWNIFLLSWFASLGLCMMLADNLAPDSPPLMLLIMAIFFAGLCVFLIYSSKRTRRRSGPTCLICENCGAPAFQRPELLGVKVYIRNSFFGSDTRSKLNGFKDICPNCGNDNRVSSQNTP